MVPWLVRRYALWATTLAIRGVLSDNLLVTNGFDNCIGTNNETTIIVNDVDIRYNNADKTVIFNVAGSNTREQKVEATIQVKAYGQVAFTQTFKPCDPTTFVKQLCPVPVGNFAANGTQEIPQQYADQIPAIAFQIPDISADATLTLTSLDDNSTIGCVQSQITNGKTVAIPAVSYVAATIAAGALVLTGITAVGSVLSGGAGAASSIGGAGTISPSFGEVFGVFHGFALNGMMSASLPQVYRSFSKNFAFSTGLIPWRDMQVGIDNLRGMTGGNLTRDSVEVLEKSTLVFPDGSTSSANSSAIFKRATRDFLLAIREINTSINSTDTASDGSSTEAAIRRAVSGIQGYVNMLSVPESNTFLTILEIVAIVIGVIIVSILLVKVILEAWALFGNFPKKLVEFRKHYWGSIARSVTSLILLLYGVWVLYCVYQFTKGDSWAAQTLAAVTLALFTGILAFFSWKIWSTAKKLKEAEGDATGLYEDKQYWRKYSLFYDSYKKSCWWAFIPAIAYLFAKGTVIAVTDGYAMAQTISSLVIEALFLILLVWNRPFERKASNVVNITIQVVRVLSVILILVFVEELGLTQTTQTVAGVALIAVQSALAVALAILIFWNAILSLCQRKPHQKRIEAMAKAMQRDTLTPLDARNSLLKGSITTELVDGLSSTRLSPIAESKAPAIDVARRGSSPRPPLGSSPERSNSFLQPPNLSRPVTPVTPWGADQSQEHLISHAAPIHVDRQPTLPNLEGLGNSYGPTVGSGHQRYNSGSSYRPYRT
ncbi:TRP-domain-containing protein [Xylariaceae sp. FL1272]|nr:TRP-domain-containing protein [Xylariaceae sp. FL1272]